MIYDDNQALDEFATRWSSWHRSRRLFAPPVPQNILARMRPQPVREAPDAIMSSDLSIFNLAVLAQEESAGKQAFIYYYLHEIRPVKLAADHLKMTRAGFYKAMWAFRKDAYRSYRNMMAGNIAQREEGAVVRFGAATPEQAEKLRTLVIG